MSKVVFRHDFLAFSVTLLCLLVGMSAIAQVGELDYSFGDGMVFTSFCDTNEGDSPKAIAVYGSGSTHAGKIVVAGLSDDTDEGNDGCTIVRITSAGAFNTHWSYSLISSTSFEHINKLILDDGPSDSKNMHLTRDGFYF